MELQRIGIKFFALDSAAIHLRDFVPIFHAWIQKQCIADHLLIDVHDYSHIYNGPGILLVAHEGNISMDGEGGRLGMFYYRKQSRQGSPEERLASVLKSAAQACSLLENDSGIRFRTDELLVVANDRLSAPNEDLTLSEFSPALSSILKRAFGGADVSLTPANSNPKDRFAVRAQTKASMGFADLLAALG